jgi:amidase
VGLQVIAAPRADRRVLEVGHAFEQATRHGERRPELG